MDSFCLQPADPIQGLMARICSMNTCRFSEHWITYWMKWSEGKRSEGPTPFFLYGWSYEYQVPFALDFIEPIRLFCKITYDECQLFRFLSFDRRSEEIHSQHGRHWIAPGGKFRDGMRPAAWNLVKIPWKTNDQQIWKYFCLQKYPFLSVAYPICMSIDSCFEIVDHGQIIGWFNPPLWIPVFNAVPIPRDLNSAR
jgi:hypothetical protein